MSTFECWYFCSEATANECESLIVKFYILVTACWVALFACTHPASGAPILPDCQPPETRAELWWESLVGSLETDCWRPLSFAEFLSDGWESPYDSISHHTPRQTWINSADGAFYRLAVLSGSWAQGTSEVTDTANGSVFLFTPFNRRFEIGWFLPFSVIAPDVTSPVTKTFRGTGDLTVAPRFLLAEDKEYSFTANCYIRCPTGNVLTGNGVTSLSPDIEFWLNPTGKWILRGGVGVTVPTNLTAGLLPLLEANPWTGFNLSPSAFSSFDARVAGGLYLTDDEAPFFKHLCGTVSTNLHTQINGGNMTYFSVTPGMRTGVSRDWYLLAGFEVPLVGPLPFSNQAIVQLIKNF